MNRMYVFLCFWDSSSGLISIIGIAGSQWDCPSSSHSNVWMSLPRNLANTMHIQLCLLVVASLIGENWYIVTFQSAFFLLWVKLYIFHIFKSHIYYFLLISSCACLLLMFPIGILGFSLPFLKVLYILSLLVLCVSYLLQIFPPIFIICLLTLLIIVFDLLNVGFCFVFILNNQTFLSFFFLHLDFGVIARKPFSKLRSQRKDPSFVLQIVWFHFLHFRSPILWNSFLGYDAKNRSTSFLNSYLVFSKTFNAKPTLAPLMCNATFITHYISVCRWGYFWTFYSTDLSVYPGAGTVMF